MRRTHQLGLVGWLTLVAETVMAAGVQAGATAAGCRGGNPMANVRDPTRLKVVSACQSASGVVVRTHTEGDADVATPKVGAHVTATGPYVEDTAHTPTHMEIHPAWSITAH